MHPQRRILLTGVLLVASCSGAGVAGPSGSGGSSSGGASGGGGTSASGGASGTGGSGGRGTGGSTGSGGRATGGVGGGVGVGSGGRAAGGEAATGGAGGAATWSCVEVADALCFCNTSATDGGSSRCMLTWPCCFAGNATSCECADQQTCDDVKAQIPGVRTVPSCPPPP
jgi:hypothetical protein